VNRESVGTTPAAATLAAARALMRPPPPVEGSPGHFALLYSPVDARARLAAVLALANEISVGAARQLDHAVAHVRLEWWRGEAERYARGEPQHPWLRALLAQDPVRCLNLQRLVEAAALDLATDSLSARPATALQRAVFELAEAALRTPVDAEPPAPHLQRALGDLGERAAELERYASTDGAPAVSAPMPAGTPAAAGPAAALEALRRLSEAIDRALQPRLTPLLVWIALAARQAQRRARRGHGRSASGLDGVADNLVAWRAARRAARGRFRLD
jgi:hypothetical protein